MILAMMLGCGRCGSLSDLAPADVLYVGDSVLAWNDKTCRSIGAYAANQRGIGYDNLAVNGARVLGGASEIPLQSMEGEWAQVVMLGGANDLNAICDCDRCDDIMNGLVSEDGETGALPELADAWVETGARVTMLGYYPVRDNAWYGFKDCFDTITELDRRVARAARLRDAVEFFDLGDVIGPENRGVYAFDHAHPSPEGAERLGVALAERL